MMKRARFFHASLCSAMVFALAAAAQAEGAGPACAGAEGAYRDFDFLLGEWDYFSADGEPAGQTVYSRQAEGCLILEQWTGPDGDTGVGMIFLDPQTGLWRHVWMSARFHMDMSGKKDGNGAMVLEGYIHSNARGDRQAIRGLWRRDGDGPVRHAYERRDDETGDWRPFFAGESRLRGR